MEKMEKNALITPETIQSLEVLADHAFSSKHFEKLGGKAGIFCIAMYALELGLPPMTCLFGGMRPVLGNIELSPRLMNGMIRKAGHRIEIQECTNEKCTIKGVRHDTKEEYFTSFTMQEARSAGLVRSGGGWEKYPSDMLFARCLSRLARRLFPDIISSAYVDGEIDDTSHTSPSKDMRENGEEKKETSQALDVVIEDKGISAEEFVEKIKEKVGDKYTLENMSAYVEEISREKGVSIQKIREQALNSALTERFCRSWKKWNDELEDSSDESLTRT
jgi:hypothetical protein